MQNTSDKGYAIEAISADLSLAEAPQALIEAASQTGPVTALINNASLFSYDCAVSVSAEQIARHMAVNLTAPALLTRALYEQLPVGQTGCVINMLDAKLFGINPDYFSYTLSKAAAQSLTQISAQAYAPKLRVNAIAPALSCPRAGKVRQNLKNPKTEFIGTGRNNTRNCRCNALVTYCFIYDRRSSNFGWRRAFMPAARDVAFLEA